MTAEAVEVADELVDAASITDGKAIVKFDRTEHALAELRKKYADVKYDLTTTKGDAAARAARKELVSLRTGLDRKRKDLKAPAQEFSKKIDSEAERLRLEIVSLEDPIDSQIKADEARREAEKVAREKAEAARVEALRLRVNAITDIAVRAATLSSEDIKLCITEAAGLAVDDSFEEFLPAAAHARIAAVGKLNELLAAAVKREEAEAEAKRTRERLAELERENAERAAREAEERAARERAEAQERRRVEHEQRQRLAQQEAAVHLMAEIQRVRKRAFTASSAGLLELATLLEGIALGPELGEHMKAVEDAKREAIDEVHQFHEVAVRREAEKRENDRIRAEQEAAQRRIDEQTAELARREEALKPKIEPVALPPAEAPMADAAKEESLTLPGDYFQEGEVVHTSGVNAPVEPAVVDTRPNITTAHIGKRLGFKVNQAFLEDVLGVVHQELVKGSIQWHESQWPEIKVALIKHVEGLPE